MTEEKPFATISQFHDLKNEVNIHIAQCETKHESITKLVSDVSDIKKLVSRVYGAWWLLGIIVISSAFIVDIALKFIK